MSKRKRKRFEYKHLKNNFSMKGGLTVRSLLLKHNVTYLKTVKEKILNINS